jgi:Lrp/AsnC family leucine-responsive transcriptional regulator
VNPLSGRYLRRSAITCQTPPVEANARTDRGEPLGDIDARILRLLASDGRMSYADLARETGLSTSAVHQRVRRLEQRGVIRGYRAVIDLTPLDPSAPDDIPQRVEDFPEIEACWSVAGAASYVVKVRVAEPEDLEDLLARIRAAAGVSTRTTIVLSTPFEDRPAAI